MSFLAEQSRAGKVAMIGLLVLVLVGGGVVGGFALSDSRQPAKTPQACVTAIRDYQTAMNDLKAISTKAATGLESLIGTLTVTAVKSKGKAVEATLAAKEPGYKALLAKTKAAALECGGSAVVQQSSKTSPTTAPKPAPVTATAPPTTTTTTAPTPAPSATGATTAAPAPTVAPTTTTFYCLGSLKADESAPVRSEGGIPGTVNSELCHDSVGTFYDGSRVDLSDRGAETSSVPTTTTTTAPPPVPTTTTLTVTPATVTSTATGWNPSITFAATVTPCNGKGTLELVLYTGGLHPWITFPMTPFPQVDHADISGITGPSSG